MVYMKGVPDAPQCGFSALAVKVLQHYGNVCTVQNLADFNFLL